jgi:hypothetical protein
VSDNFTNIALALIGLVSMAVSGWLTNRRILKLAELSLKATHRAHRRSCQAARSSRANRHAIKAIARDIKGTNTSDDKSTQ